MAGEGAEAGRRAGGRRVEVEGGWWRAESGERKADAVSKRKMHTYLRITGSPFWAMA